MRVPKVKAVKVRKITLSKPKAISMSVKTRIPKVGGKSAWGR